MVGSRRLRGYAWGRIHRARGMLSVGLFGVAIGGGLATSKLDPHTARHLAILCAIVSVLLAHDVRQLIWGDTQSKSAGAAPRHAERHYS